MYPDGTGTVQSRPTALRPPPASIPGEQALHRLGRPVKPGGGELRPGLKVHAQPAGQRVRIVGGGYRQRGVTQDRQRSLFGGGDGRAEAGFEVGELVGAGGEPVLPLLSAGPGGPPARQLRCCGRDREYGWVEQYSGGLLFLPPGGKLACLYDLDQDRARVVPFVVGERTDGGEAGEGQQPVERGEAEQLLGEDRGDVVALGEFACGCLQVESWQRLGKYRAQASCGSGLGGAQLLQVLRLALDPGCPGLPEIRCGLSGRRVC